MNGRADRVDLTGFVYRMSFIAYSKISGHNHAFFPQYPANKFSYVR
jgi:hypothetical protein